MKLSFLFYLIKEKSQSLSLSQIKPVQVGWLLLAPEDTDFSSSGHRKRVMNLAVLEIIFPSDTGLYMSPCCKCSLDLSLPSLLQKWQRRYFVLYEHGLLRYSLDEMVRFNLFFMQCFQTFYLMYPTISSLQKPHH